MFFFFILSYWIRNNAVFWTIYRAERRHMWLWCSQCKRTFGVNQIENTINCREDLYLCVGYTTQVVILFRYLLCTQLVQHVISLAYTMDLGIECMIQFDSITTCDQRIDTFVFCFCLKLKKKNAKSWKKLFKVICAARRRRRRINSPK